MRYSITIAGQPHLLTIERDEHQRWQIQLDDRLISVDAAQISAGRFSLLIDDHSYEVFARPLPQTEDTADARQFEVILDGTPHTIELVDEHRRALAGMATPPGGHSEVSVKAPMPGLVVGVLVAAGDTVERNQRVAVLEAMKMQNDLLAPRSGTVKAVKVEKGQAVNQGQVLVVLGD